MLRLPCRPSIRLRTNDLRVLLIHATSDEVRPRPVNLGPLCNIFRPLDLGLGCVGFSGHDAGGPDRFDRAGATMHVYPSFAAVRAWFVEPNHFARMRCVYARAWTTTHVCPSVAAPACTRFRESRKFDASDPGRRKRVKCEIGRLKFVPMRKLVNHGAHSKAGTTQVRYRTVGRCTPTYPMNARPPVSLRSSK